MNPDEISLHRTAIYTYLDPAQKNTPDAKDFFHRLNEDLSALSSNIDSDSMRKWIIAQFLFNQEREKFFYQHVDSMLREFEYQFSWFIYTEKAVKTAFNEQIRRINLFYQTWLSILEEKLTEPHLKANVRLRRDFCEYDFLPKDKLENFYKLESSLGRIAKPSVPLLFHLYLNYLTIAERLFPEIIPIAKKIRENTEKERNQFNEELASVLGLIPNTKIKFNVEDDLSSRGNESILTQLLYQCSGEHYRKMPKSEIFKPLGELALMSIKKPKKPTIFSSVSMNVEPVLSAFSRNAHNELIDYALLSTQEKESVRLTLARTSFHRKPSWLIAGAAILLLVATGCMTAGIITFTLPLFIAGCAILLSSVVIMPEIANQASSIQKGHCRKLIRGETDDNHKTSLFPSWLCFGHKKAQKKEESVANSNDIQPQFNHAKQ